MDERKTAVLFRAAAAAGAMVGGATDRQVRRLADFGDRIGLAFQIVDDILDTSADTAQDADGESPSRQSGRAQLRSFADARDAQGRAQAGRRSHAASLADLSEARQRAEELSESAIVLLQPFGDRAARLREMARFVVERTE